MNEIIQGDCLELMKQIPDASIDMVLCDLPYGTTQIDWDTVIDLQRLWQQYNRLVKLNGAVVLFSAQPFTTDLINSNRKLFRYEIIWHKTQAQGFLNANKMPLRAHENILVFYKKLPTFNPQKTVVERANIGRVREVNAMRSKQYREMNRTIWIESGQRYPTDVIKFSNWNGALFGKTAGHVQHPTAKPVALFEWLIRTYTNEGDVVLDNCIGSGTTAVAAHNTGRNFIGIELRQDYCDLARSRLTKTI